MPIHGHTVDRYKQPRLEVTKVSAIPEVINADENEALIT